MAFQHSLSRLTYALNEKGQIVNIDEVPTGARCKCFCPACKEPLIAKNSGAKRIHHFAHQSGTECEYAVESMLHILAKEKIREAFLSKSEYFIEFEYKSYCHKYDTCVFVGNGGCCTSKINRFDLKQFYDSCEQEIPYDNINCRSDLKIFSSKDPNRAPVYLEFCVSHASDNEKLHSGNKIIEIWIETEDDITELCQDGIVQSPFKVCFYGFKEKDFINKNIINSIEFIRYILHKSGKSICIPDSCDCDKIVKSSPNSLLEICVHTIVQFGVFDQAKYIGYKQFGIPNCVLCTNYVQSYYDDARICRLYKRLHIPRDGMDTTRAKSCYYFTIDHQEMNSALENDLGDNYTIFTNK